jgi:hypothetical protein
MKNMKNILWPAVLLLATTTVGFAENKGYNNNDHDKYNQCRRDRDYRERCDHDRDKYDRDRHKFERGDKYGHDYGQGDGHKEYREVRENLREQPL